MNCLSLRSRCHSTWRWFPAIIGAAFWLLPVSPVVGEKLFDEDFTGYSVGSLDGQGGWVLYYPPEDLVFTVANTTPLTYSDYKGGGGLYVAATTPASYTSSRLRKTYASGQIDVDTEFYLAFLLRMPASLTTAEPIVGLGSWYSDNHYEYVRVEAQASGGGYNLGISKGSDLGGNNPTPVWGSTLLSLGQTYLVVVRYSFSTATNDDDQAWLWIDPPLSSEPNPADAEAAISSGNDILYPGDTLDYLNLCYRINGPGAELDGLKVARSTASSAEAWGFLDPLVPVELLRFTVE